MLNDKGDENNLPSHRPVDQKSQIDEFTQLCVFDALFKDENNDLPSPLDILWNEISMHVDHKSITHGV